MKNLAIFYVIGGKLYNLWKDLFREAKDERLISDVISSRPTGRRKVYSIPGNCSLYECLAKMKANGVSALFVTDEGQRDSKFVGLITISDIHSSLLAHEGLSSTKVISRTTPISKAIYSYPGNSVESVLEMMAYYKVHHMPISLGGNPTDYDMVSLNELVGLTVEQRDARSASYAMKNKDITRDILR